MGDPYFIKIRNPLQGWTWIGLVWFCGKPLTKPTLKYQRFWEANQSTKCIGPNQSKPSDYGLVSALNHGLIEFEIIWLQSIWRNEDSHRNLKGNLILNQFHERVILLQPTRLSISKQKRNENKFQLTFYTFTQLSIFLH